MTFIIIEDEPHGRLFLQEMMAHYFPEWKLLGVCSNVSEGIQAIKQLKPTLVLLDIEIGEGNGFQVLDEFEKPDFRVIFITGYEHYSLRAIKYAALDYLLKPLSIEDLRAALNRFEQQQPQADPRLEIFKHELQKPRHKNQQLVIPSGRSYNVVQFSEITHLTADGRYVYVHMEDGTKILASHPIGYYEKLFEESEFVRIHKSHIVNLNKVSRLITSPELRLELKNKIRIDIALRRKDFVIGELKSRNIA